MPLCFFRYNLISSNKKSDYKYCIAQINGHDALANLTWLIRSVDNNLTSAELSTCWQMKQLTVSIFSGSINEYFTTQKLVSNKDRTVYHYPLCSGLVIYHSRC